MKPGLVDIDIVELVTRADFVGTFTRRGVLSRLGAALVACMAISGMRSPTVDAKRKKKKQKKADDKPLKTSDWDGFWHTRLSSGVSGTANLSYDTSIDLLFGTYSNSVGNGDFRCYPVTDANPFSCFGPWYQTDGSSGYLTMELEDAGHWYGTFSVDGGDSGTWSGVR